MQLHIECPLLRYGAFQTAFVHLLPARLSSPTHNAKLLSSHRSVLCARKHTPTASLFPSARLRARIPTWLTYARLLAVPALTLSGLPNAYAGQRALTTALFVGAAVTDWADGYLARAWAVSSKFGAFLDPVADKLMVAAALVLVCVRFARGPASVPLAASAIVILTREIFVSALREWMATAGARDTVSVGAVGKVKTAAQMIALTVLLAAEKASSSLGRVGTMGLVLSAALAAMSAVGYIRAASGTFKRS